MFGLLKKQAYPIGIDISDDSVKLVQLTNNNKGLGLVAGISDNKPQDIQADSADWQRWAIDALYRLTWNGRFQGKEVIAAMPKNKVYIDLIKKPKIADEKKLNDAIFSKIKQKLPFEADQSNTMLKYMPTGEENVLVMATERKIIERHLAIYEKAGLTIKSIGVWPMALVNCYTRFFGRRKSDLASTVMLVEIEANCTNIVICRHRNLLFARSISIGYGQLEDEAILTRLVLEITGCKRHFLSLHRDSQVERLIFLSNRAADRNIYEKIAQKLEMPAQVGDCLAAIDMSNAPENSKEQTTGTLIDRRDCQMNWSVAFGLSLS
jgi:type IV pilus assembly protein PilM